VGLELPSELTEPLSWIGLIWPEADEEKLFEAGTRWISFGTSVSGILDNADASAKMATASADMSVDSAVAAFEHWWNDDDGPAKRLPADANAAMIIGGALIVFAGLTLALKIAFIVQLITLAIEVAQAIATAFVSFGATTAEIPGFVAATRVICRQLIKQVVEHIQTVIKELLEKAKNLFKLVKSKVGRKEAEALVGDLKNLKMKSLERHYVGEADPNNPMRAFFPKTVHYMSDAERDAHRLEMRGGKLYRSDGTLFDTTNAATAHSGGGRAMFVMDGEGNMYASTVQDVGRLHHSSFLSGGDVAGAGEISVKDGVLQEITRKSGHYRPPEELQQQVLDVLGAKGIDVSSVYAGSGF
jgi:nucleoside diphosphate kinase